MKYLLRLLVVLMMGSAYAQSNLPACQGSDVLKWTNCFGTETYAADSDKYVGEFKDGKRNGQGTYTFGAYSQWKGDKYVGEWKDGNRNGQGTYTFAITNIQSTVEGGKYVGEWKDNKRNGQGTFTYRGGSKYVGEWKDNKRNGQGIEYRADGAISGFGRWADDKLAQSFAIDTKLNDPALRSLPWRERLERAVQAELLQWLTADASGLEEIPPPVYPAALSLKQEVWDTNNEFEVRVEAARSERRSTIEGLQADYRAKVEQRNMRVAEYNKTRQDREAGLAKRREILITTGLAILAPAITLSDVAFDQRSGLLTISAQIDGLGLQVFAFKDAPQAFRRSALTDAGTMKAIPQFQVSTTGDISLQALSVEAGGATVRGTPSVGVASSLQLASVILPAQAPALVQQGALTVDRNQVEQILYRDENEMLRKRLEDQRRQQEAALAAAENRAAQEIARIRAEAQRVGVEVVRAPQAQVQEAHALVIGNSSYRGSERLENPTRDAKAMSAKLSSMGFKVTELGNTNREQMVKGLSEFTRTASKADLTLLFYAGHGMQVQGVNYMIPVDMSLNDPSLATLQAVSLTQVVEQYMPGKTKLVFLDACRDNPIVSAGVRGASKGLAPINVSEGTLIAYATKDGQTAEDGVGSKNSPFTQALLEHLSDPQDIGVVLRKVREKVMRATGGKQQPWEYGSLTGGELVLSAIKPK
jgi:hypothetical protein